MAKTENGIVTGTASGTVVEVEAGQNILLDAAGADLVVFSQDGSDLIVTSIADGGKIILEGFFSQASSELPPQLTLADGSVISSAEVTGLVEEFDPDQVAPAAGPGAGGAGGGASFGAYADDGIGEGIGISGLLDPTELGFPPGEPLEFVVAIPGQPELLLNEIGLGAFSFNEESEGGLFGQLSDLGFDSIDSFLALAGNSELDYIELRNNTNSTQSTAGNGPSTVGEAFTTLSIIGPDGEPVSFDLPTVEIPAGGQLVIMQTVGESGVETIFVLFDAAGTVLNAGPVPGADTEWPLGDDSTDPTGVLLTWSLGGDVVQIDTFLANGAAFEPASANDFWEGVPGDNTALDIFGDSGTFNGQISIQEVVAPGIFDAYAPITLEQLVEVSPIAETFFLDIDVNNIFARVDNHDSNSAADWTTGQTNSLGLVNDVSDPNPQDPYNDDMNPGQPAGPSPVVSPDGDEDIDNDGQNVIVVGENSEEFTDEGGVVRGGAAQDFIFGDDADNTLDGGAHNDFLDGGAGNDVVDGGSGGDVIVDDQGQDILIGGTGTDIVFGRRGAESGETVADGDEVGNEAGSAQEGEGDLLIGDQALAGGFPEEIVFEDDMMYGGGGNDFMYGQGFKPLSKEMYGEDSEHTDESQDASTDGVDDDGQTYMRDIIVAGDGSDIIYGDNAHLAEGFTPADIDTLYNTIMAAAFSNPYEFAYLYRDYVDWNYGGADLIYGGWGNDVIFGQGGEDAILAGHGDDLAAGGSGADMIRGNSGDDTIYGDTGNDTLFGDAGDDVMLGLEDDDLMYGGDGDDVMYGGSGNDVMYGGDGADKMFGGSGDDVMYGGTGNDTMHGERGDDVMYGDAGNDQMFGGAGDDIMYGGTGNDDMHGGSGNDVMYGDSEGDYMRGDSGADVMYGGTGNDTMSGGSGDDVMYGEEGDDSMQGNEGADTMYGGAGSADTISGGGDNDLMFGDKGDGAIVGDDDLMYGDGGDDVMFGEGGADTMSGGTGNDTMSGGHGNDVMFGDSGDDSMSGNEGDDLMFGGAGNDIMSGDDGDDVMYGGTQEDEMSGGAGNDIMYGDDGDSSTGGGVEDDTMHGGTGNDTMYGEDDADLMYGESGNDVMYGEDGFASSFGGGEDDTMYGGTGNDTMFGEDEDDVMYGGADDDVMSGGVGDDIMYGDQGNDSMSGNEGADTMYGGSGSSDTMQGGSGNDLMFGDNGDNARVGDDDFMYGGSGDDTMFGEGGADVMLGGSGNDDMYGGRGADTMHGGTGNDDMYGEKGNDLMFGGAGNDDMYGGTGNDTMHGGTGNDDMYGEKGDDLMFGGAGNDDMYGGKGADTMHGGTGNDDMYGEKGNDLMFGGAGNDDMYGGTGNDSMHGGTGNDDMYGEDGNDKMFGGAGNDDMYGGAGNDTMHGGTGNDDMEGGSGNDLMFGDAGNDSMEGDDGNDTMSGGQGSDTMKGGGGADRMFGNLGNDSMKGGGGDDVLVGGAGNDTMEGEDGNDTMYGGAGNDVMYGGSGNDDMQGNSGDDVMYGDGSDQGQMLKHGYEGNDDVMRGGAGDDTMYGQGGDDLMFGGAGNDEMHGGSGDDTMYGGAGNDDMSGDSGDDALYGQAGDDTMAGGSGNDTMSGGAGDDVMYGDSGDDAMTGNSGSDTMFGGAGSSDTMQGGADADVMYGDNGDGAVVGDDDVMTGGAGNDTMFGDGGADTMRGNADDDQMHGGAGNDDIRGGDGDDLIFGDAGDDDIYAGDGNDTVWGASNNSRNGVDDDDFADLGDGNDVFDDNFIDSGSDTVLGGAGNDKAWTGDGDDSLIGGTGNDTLNGENDEDILRGGDDNDRLSGGRGDDTLSGDAGSDVVRGDSGADVLQWTMSTNETGTVDNYNGGSGSDTLELYFTQAEFDANEEAIAEFANRVENGEDVSLNIGGRTLNAVDIEYVAVHVDGDEIPVLIDDTITTDEDSDVTATITATASTPGQDFIPNDQVTNFQTPEAVTLTMPNGTPLVFAATEWSPSGDVWTMPLADGADDYGSLIFDATDPENVQVTLDIPEGVSIYDPMDDGEVATLVFDYSASVEGSESATITINVNGVNDAPVAGDDIVITNTLDGIYIPQYAMLANDTDIDDEPLHVESVTPPATIIGDYVFTEGANRVQNGSFEDHSEGLNKGHGSSWATYDSLPGGWMVDLDGANAPIELQFGNTGGIGAQDGNSKMEIDSHREGRNLEGDKYTASNAHVYQDVPTEAGEMLTVSFWYSPRTTTSTNGVEVHWNGELLTTLSGSTPGWQEFAFEVEAGTGDTTRLEFQGLPSEDTLGGYIDNVYVGDRSYEYDVSDGDETDTGAVTVHYQAGGVLQGGDENEIIIGGEGADTILGGDGDDTIIGGDGNDAMDAGDGADTFHYSDVDAGDDVIYGFEENEDVINLDALFDELGIDNAEDRADMINLEVTGSDTTVTIDGADDFSITLKSIDLGDHDGDLSSADLATLKSIVVSDES